MQIEEIPAVSLFALSFTCATDSFFFFIPCSDLLPNSIRIFVRTLNKPSLPGSACTQRITKIAAVSKVLVSENIPFLVLAILLLRERQRGRSFVRSFYHRTVLLSSFAVICYDNRPVKKKVFLFLICVWLTLTFSVRLRCSSLLDRPVTVFLRWKCRGDRLILNLAFTAPEKALRLNPT